MLMTLHNSSTSLITYYAHYCEDYLTDLQRFQPSWWQILAAIGISCFLFKRLVLERFYMQYEGKWVVVTGCDSGFGRRTSLYLISQGVNVFAGCYTEKGEIELQKEASEINNGKLFTSRLDITKDESVNNFFHFVRNILSQHNSSLWGLVNNAGFFSIYGPDDWCSVEEFRNSLDVNALGAVRMCHKFKPLLKHSKGRIVTMGSSAGRIHGLFVASYVTAKFALEAYMDCLRLEMRPFGVSVHLLEPGAFKTDLLSEHAQNQRVDTIWQRLPETVKIEYGESFKENFKQAWNMGVSIVANSNLQWVVDHYFHALFAKWPRLRYYTGYDAIFCFIPLSLFPTFVQDSLLSGMYALQPGPSLVPEVLRTKSK